MKEIENFADERFYPIDEAEAKAVLLPLLLYQVSCGFPSPSADYIEEPIDILGEIVRHPKTTFVWRAGGDSMRDRLIDVGTLIVFDRMITPKSGEAAAVRIGGDLCVREVFIDHRNGKQYLRACNENYAPIEVTEEMDVEILGKVIWTVTKQ